MQSRIDKLCEKMHDNEAVFISSYPNIFYYSGFTSEDAYLLISHSGKYIITDSRYTIQAREQAKGFEVIDIAKGFEKIFSYFSGREYRLIDCWMTARPAKRGAGSPYSYYVVISRGTLLDQIGDGHAFQIVMDHLIQPLPQRQRAALLRPGAGFSGSLQTGHRGEGLLRQPQDAAHRVLLGVLRQPVSAALAPQAFHDLCLYQRPDNAL